MPNYGILMIIITDLTERSEMNYSRQRQSILEYLQSTKSHPTAEMVYNHVREEYPRISLATVYRNLSQLLEAGEIIKISTGDSFEHYDADTSPHSHYFCRCCHRVMDIYMAPTAEQILSASSVGIGTVEKASLLFTGVCRDCLMETQAEH